MPVVQFYEDSIDDVRAQILAEHLNVIEYLEIKTSLLTTRGFAVLVEKIRRRKCPVATILFSYSTLVVLTLSILLFLINYQIFVILYQ